MRVIRPGFLLGFAAGYVMGAKAGRERYRQIEAMWHRLLGSPSVQTLQHEMSETMATVGHIAEQKASAGASVVADKLEHARERMSKSDDAADGGMPASAGNEHTTPVPKASGI